MTQKIFIFLLMTCLCIAVPAQELEPTAGSLVMMRSDNGDGEFLSSPSSMNLSGVQTSFDTSVDTIVFVHGFNNSYDKAKTTFTQVATSLRGKLGTRNYVGFYWPSDTLIDFGQAVENANTAGKYLVYALGKISGWYGSSGRSVHVVTHSLGGRVLFSTLKQNEARYVKWGACMSMAPAVHKDVYFGSFNGVNSLPRQTIVYYSKGDYVLEYFYTLYYWLFERNGFAGTPEYEKFKALSLEEKIAYMRKLHLGSQRGDVPTNEFDRHLLTGIERAEVEAMGFVGAWLGNPVSVSKVANTNMEAHVDGHSYWESAEMMNRIAQTVK